METKSIQISVIDVGAKKLHSDAVTLDEALELAKIGKYQRILILLTGLCVMGAISENVSISFVMPQIRCDLSVSTAEQGVLSSISFVGIVVSSHMWGFLADTWGRQKVLRISMLGGFAACFASAFAWSTWSLILLRFVGGVFLSGGQAAGYSYISEFHTGKAAASATAFVTAFMPACFIHLTLLAILFLPMDWQFGLGPIEMKPWRVYMMAVSLLNLWSFVVFNVMPESPKFLLVKDREDEALQVLRQIYAVNSGEPKDSFPVNRLAGAAHGNSVSHAKGFSNVMRFVWSQTKPVFQPPLLTHTVKFCWILFVIYFIGHGTIMWFPDFIIQMKSYKGGAATLCQIVGLGRSEHVSVDNCDIDNKNISVFLVMLGMGVIFIAASSVSSYGIRFINPKRIVFVWLLISACSAVSLNFWTDVNLSIAFFIVFVSCAVCASQVMAVAVNLFPTSYRSMATSFIVMSGRIGSAAGSNAVGLLLKDHCAWIFYFAAGALICSVFTFMAVKTNNTTKKTPA